MSAAEEIHAEIKARHLIWGQMATMMKRLVCRLAGASYALGNARRMARWRGDWWQITCWSQKIIAGLRRELRNWAREAVAEARAAWLQIQAIRAVLAAGRAS